MDMKKVNTFIITVLLLLFTAAIITHPQASFDASKNGLAMWWEVVFPSLLPFFILSELLIGFGIVTFVGLLLEPFMRPVFRVPGVGGFVLAMGMASGFPSGAKLTSRLRQERQISRVEAERLASFTNSSNPLFIFGAVAVGFFHNPALGIVLAAAHYLGNVAVGVTMRSYGKKEEVDPDRNKRTRRIPSIKEALKALHQARLEEKRPLGKLLSDAVISSVQTLLMVGGFIILFSVFNNILSVVHITDILSQGMRMMLSVLHFPIHLDKPLLSGVFEITLGSQLVSAANAPLLAKAIIVSFILGFSGFCVQAQVAGILAETDIRFKPFFIARFLQGIYAALFVPILWKPLYTSFTQLNEPVFLFFRDGKTESLVVQVWNSLVQIGPLVTIGTLFIYLILYTKTLSLEKK
ncbi:sporulation integral membrane protein YlbJ [Bacillus sp. WMMC1349]|uniref:sporulation integral membrane protein YlbJ n=1 Tax=Bacillus sp. WMMC1349 TaxID=2736254 RepID=UPI001556BE37|nr:sporulation integral membrane protein YlbJ [Bacillus sp. WMMC1349]NPC92456.1 sporulation integral membrane protein YlbJ [Bacillus sp. WMMC1349]